MLDWHLIQRGCRKEGKNLDLMTRGIEWGIVVGTVKVVLFEALMLEKGKEKGKEKKVCVMASMSVVTTMKGHKY